jgi:hypothetical protein
VLNAVLKIWETAMALKHEEYAKNLANVHGIEHALKIVTSCLEICKRQRGPFFDEGDFTINEQGKYDLARVQSKNKLDLKERRQKENINFYSEVLTVLNRILKNAAS